jgi:hypothetical protein
VAEAAREQEALQRACQRAREALLQQLASKQGVEDHLTVREMNRISLRTTQYIVGELGSCHDSSSRRDVLERVMCHNIVWPLLPAYYPHLQEAKVIHNFIENFKHELQLVKVANSNKFLARKNALLDAAVSLGIDGVTALARVLDTTTKSINLALHRRVYASDVVERGPRLCLVCEKRVGLSECIKECIEVWWNGQTKVSPNKKDIVMHRVARNVLEELHPTYYLCET